MASLPPPPPSSPHAEVGAGTAAVCCMCGDQGLPDELVRCRRCWVRLQHRYCSDLYPRAAAYRRCNWCLREPATASNQQGRRAALAVAASKAEERRKAASACDEERRRRQRHEGCSSRRPPAEPGHPVKKKHKADQEKMPPPPPPQAAEEIVAEASGRKEVMRAGKTRVSRVKVRRYKLLAEVISC
jgi:hypothetical protein